MIALRSTVEALQRENQRLRIVNAKLEAHAEIQDHNLEKMREMYDALMVDFKAMKLQGAVVIPPPEPVLVEQPDVPPAVVLAAMHRISPLKDKAFEANWAYWERNKQTAAAHPEAFAEDILRGVEGEVQKLPVSEDAA